ncbi:GGDEF domain-containing protein [Campylobacter mucosalis]|uniref:diguanylate cyclase n=1 Tax=Campylobacter mucosalis CCUG 21559 TaxID=1032067 RepID=A0A6G5QJJ4_9BACT|nr:GGDEF domain-containing protein [Campylobacter mucosalis]QCD45646.1 diguanylate cyclase [Campylobacter mucosalis CCUG 21559]
MFSVLDKTNYIEYKSADGIYRFLLDMVVVFNILSTSIFFILNHTLMFVSAILVIITLIVRVRYSYKYKNFSILWVHCNVIYISVSSTAILGFSSGFYLCLVLLVYSHYFCTFNNKIFSYAISLGELAILIAMKPNFQNSYGLPQWFSNMSFVICSLIVFFVIIRLGMFANFLTTSSYKELKDERDELERLSKHDYLTGLLNRRSIEHIIKYKPKIFKKPNSVLIMGDIDNFKFINDTYGHNWGDRVLQDIATTLKKIFRKDDFICRWGGEEFLIIIPEANIEFIHSLPKRLLKNISNNKLPSGASVTMTFGMVIFLNGFDDNFTQMIKKADELLYRGKKNGKDRVEMEIQK